MHGITKYMKKHQEQRSSLVFYRTHMNNKKVLLHERKRHTARRVVSTPSVVLTGYPPPGRVPPHPDLAGGYPTWVSPTGYPPSRVPPSRVPLWAGYPPAGYPPWLDLAGYPPRCLPHGILGNVAKHYGIWVPPRCWQTENITFPILRMRAVIKSHLPQSSLELECLRKRTVGMGSWFSASP